MKKKLSIVTLLTIVMTMCFGMTAFASPKTMPDGTVFDAEYYAKTYPDVTAVFGTDENALYQHYVTMGKAEGRKATGDTQTANTASGDAINQAVLDSMLGMTKHYMDNLDACKNDFAYDRDNRPRFTGSMKEPVNLYLEPVMQYIAKNYGYKYVLSSSIDMDSDVMFAKEYLLTKTPNVKRTTEGIRVTCSQTKTNDLSDFGYGKNYTIFEVSWADYVGNHTSNYTPFRVIE